MVAVRWQCGSSSAPITVSADDLARAAQQVALAIVVAVGHHRAVQAEQRHVHGAGVAQVLQQLVAQRFIGVASGDAGRHGGGGQAFDQRPVLALGALPRCPQRTGIHLHAVRMLAGRVIAARAVGAQAGGDGEKVLVSVAREPEKIFMLPLHVERLQGARGRRAWDCLRGNQVRSPTQACTSISTSTSSASRASTVERVGKSAGKCSR